MDRNQAFRGGTGGGFVGAGGVGGCKGTRKLLSLSFLSLFFPEWPHICAMPRDYLSDTPLLRAMGFLVSQHGQLGDTPSPFSESFPLGEHAKWRCDTPPPPQKGVSQRYLRIHYENKANGCDTPLCDAILKGYLTWAAEVFLLFAFAV